MNLKKNGIKYDNVRRQITAEILQKFLSCLDGNDYDLQTIRAILCFAKFGLLKVKATQKSYTDVLNGCL